MVEHGVEVDDRVAELAQLGHLLVELRDRDGERVSGRSLTLWYMSTRRRAIPVAVRGASVAVVSPIVR